MGLRDRAGDEEAEPGARLRLHGLATAELLEDQLLVLARDPGLRERMGAAGRERVLPRYAVDRLIDDVDELYRSLLGAEAAGASR